MSEAALKELAEYFDDFVAPAQIVEASCGRIKHKTMGWWIKDRNKNGLAPHVRRIGRNYQISVSGFREWFSGREGPWK